MDSGSDLLAIVSTAIAVLSLFVASGALLFARRADKRADRGQPSAQYLGFSVDEAQPGATVESISFKFRIKNLGAAGARHIALYLIDQTGVELPRRSSGVSLPGGQSDDVTVLVDDPEGYSYPLKVRLEWRHWERSTPLYTHDSEVVAPDPF